MVVALGAMKFYGRSLPRPRFFSLGNSEEEERVDPPAPVFEPLLCWANEAHWSMGGLSFQRHRLQGRIEGSIKKLRVHQHPSSRRMKNASAANIQTAYLKTLNSNDSSDSSSEEITAPKKKQARKLMEDFERVAPEEKPEIGGATTTVRRTSLRNLKP